MLIDGFSRLAYSELLRNERKETAAAFWQILGLHQSRLAKRRGRFRLICYLRTFVVASTRSSVACAMCFGPKLPSHRTTLTMASVYGLISQACETGVQCGQQTLHLIEFVGIQE
jgi:hypothetical protein